MFMFPFFRFYASLSLSRLSSFAFCVAPCAYAPLSCSVPPPSSLDLHSSFLARCTPFPLPRYSESRPRYPPNSTSFLLILPQLPHPLTPPLPPQEEHTSLPTPTVGAHDVYEDAAAATDQQQDDYAPEAPRGGASHLLSLLLSSRFLLRFSPALFLRVDVSRFRLSPTGILRGVAANFAFVLGAAASFS
ncbi:hypothetical protein C8J57DRAFT_1515912 [Mycena rebaudengoi]|nr:hypothetical protein C8J57DRAFT_1515912 [Mycena rebaudengoi]